MVLRGNIINDAKLPCLDLFSGIGGNSAALRSILKSVAYCEIDPFVTRILDKNMRNGLLDVAHVFPDVTKLRAKDLPVLPAVITASFPCQDISAAGSGEGVDGDRSGLVSHVFRLIDEFKRAPMHHKIMHVFMENSPCILTRGLDTIIEAFEKRGFECRWTLLSAQDVGAMHVRRRWFMLASRRSHDVRLPAAKLSRFDFDALDSIPRLVKDPSPEEKRCARARFGALGNSVVPSAVAAAWNALIMGRGRGRMLAHPEKRNEREPDPDPDPLVFSDGRRAKLWITPVRTARHFYPTNRIDGRHFHMFATQVFHELGTMRRFRFKDVVDARKRYMINPEWVEHMMGYPKGWTDCDT